MKDFKQGTFLKDLTLNFKALKEARALSVAEDTEICYKRKIEDLCREYNGMRRNRENLMLDLCPTTATSTSVVPADFKPELFLEKDVNIGIEARNIKIRLEILVNRYEELFGPFQDVEMITEVLPGWKSNIDKED